MQTSRPLLLVLGESGSGKTTLCSALERILGVKQLESYTERPRRTEDEIGHVFVSSEEYDTLTNIVAETTFNGNRYCATEYQIENSDLYVVDPAGMESLLLKYRGPRKLYVVYITAPVKDRIRRMLDRGDEGLLIAERVLHDAVAFDNAAILANTTIVNRNFTDAVLELIKCYRKACYAEA